MHATRVGAHTRDDPAGRDRSPLADVLDDPAGLEADQQEDRVLEEERDRAPVHPLRDPRLGGLEDRRLVPEQQPGDDHARSRRRRAPPRRRRRPRTGRPSEIALSSTGSVRCRRSFATTRKSAKPISDAADRRDQEVEADPPTARRVAGGRPRSRCRSATSAVASLSSDSPSRIVTIRRGSPIRRPIAVAATASGGATTAPIANAIAHETMPGSSSVRPAARPRRS